MHVLLLLLSVMFSTVYCRPERGIHHSTDSRDEYSSSLVHSSATDFEGSSQSSMASSYSEETPTLIDSDDSTSHLSSKSDEDSNKFVDVLKFPNPPKESDEDTRALPSHNPSGLDQEIGSTVTLDNTSYQEETDEVESSSSDSSENPALPLDSKKDFETEESFRKALIEDLKSRILQKLHLPSPPSNVSPFKLSPDVFQLMHGEEEESQAKEEENLIVHPSNSDVTNCTTPNCRRMTFNITSDRESVLSVQAWLNKRSSSDRLSLSVHSTSEVIATIKEDPRKFTAETGWAMFELPTMSLIEAKEGGLRCILETEGDINTEGASSPFLVVRKYIHTQQKKAKRSTRSTNENCSCCTENHYITIKELGWQNWVISPAGFNVKTCAGQCEENRSSFTINYQRIISTLYKINKTIPKPKCSFWAPTCKPDSYLPQRMMYLYDNGTMHDHLLSNMLIGSCRCL